jgi:AcrR family transcriptional regulator
LDNTGHVSGSQDPKHEHESEAAGMQVRNQRRDAVEHRKLILQTANSLFKQHGVDQVSMHQIAKSAGVGQGTLYRRYSSKGDLCFDLMNDSFGQFKSRINLYLEEAGTAALPERMRFILSECVDFMEDKAKWLGTMQSKSCEDGRERFFQSPPYLFIHTVLASLIQQGWSGEMSDGRDPDYAAHAILAAISPVLFIELRVYQGKSVDEIKQGLNMLYVDMLFMKS